MTQVLRGHYDGKVIVPDEPVSFPVDEPLVIRIESGPTSPVRPDQATIHDRLARQARVTGRIAGPSIPLEALRRENLYDERT